MTATTQLVETWKEQFNFTFQHHPRREEIMERILGDELISKAQLDKWWQEAADCAAGALNAALQQLSGEPDE